MEDKREILFRAWYEAEKEMIHNPAFGGGFNSNYMCDVNDNDEGFKDPDLIWLQYTGLKDKNGVKVFEGDIVEFTYWWFDGQENDSQLIGHIGYNSETLSFELIGIKNQDWLRHIGGDGKIPDSAPFAFFRFTEEDFKVIGNIHDNPELIK